MRKRIVSLVLALMMCFSLSVTAFAVEEESDIDALLRDRGYPQVLLDAMSPSGKESLAAKENVVFESGSIATYDEDTGTFTEMSISEYGVAPTGQISGNDLLLVWSVSKNTSTGNIEVMYTYYWLNIPANRYDDRISVSWNDDLFEMKTGSFHKVDKYSGWYLDDYGNKETETIAPITYSDEWGYGNASPAGVTWYAELKPITATFLVTSLHGYGEFTLEKLSGVGTGSSTLYGHYVHPITTGSLSVNIPFFGSFSVSGGASYDERGTQQTFSY